MEKCKRYIETTFVTPETFILRVSLMSKKDRNAREIASAIRSVGSFGRAKVIAICAAVVAVCITAVILVIVITSSKAKEKGPGPQQVDTISSLEKVVKNSSLSTYEVIYNGVATVYNEKKPEEVDYYVAYTATVKAGFDFKEIEISKDDEKKEIVVTLPPVQLYEPKVKIEELDYIVVGKKVKTETISADAYKNCKADVDKRTRNQSEIYDGAKENGERLIKGLITPFIDNLDEKYTVKFVWRDIR